MNPNPKGEIPGPEQGQSAVVPPARRARDCAFFEDSVLFEALRDAVFPALVRDCPVDRAVRVWVPCCSSGEGVYSVAIALAEYLEQHAPHLQFCVFGTDAAEAAIRQACSGVYRASALAGCSPERAGRFFHTAGNECRVAQRIRERCAFAPHQLPRDAPLARMDLVVCRNVLSGVAERLRERALVKLACALRPLGYLVLGPGERPEGAGEIYEEVDAPHGIYIRNAEVAPSRLAVSDEPEPARQAAAAGQDPGGMQHAVPPPKPAGRAGQMSEELYGAGSADRPELTRKYVEALVEELQASIEESEAAAAELRRRDALSSTLASRNAEFAEINDDLCAMAGAGDAAVTVVDRDTAKAIVESVRHAIVLLDGDFVVRDANRAFYDLVGLSPAEVVGHSLCRPRHARLEIPRVHEVLERLRAGEPHVDGLGVEYSDVSGARYLLLNGRILHIGDGRVRFLLAFHDITGQRMAAEARYRRLFETARDGIAILDAETARVVDVNPALEKLSGYSREEILGRTPWEIAGLDQAEALPGMGEARECGGLRIPERILTTKDGRQVPIEVLSSPYTEGGRTFIQLNVRDITERKKFEGNLLHTQKLESLGRLAGGVAHDFNNLLTGVLGNASLAYSRVPIDSPLRPQLREIMRAAERAAFLTRQMLAYAGKGRFVVQRLDAGELIREISALIRASVPKTVEVVFDIAPGLPSIEADSGQMQQLMMNLVTNGAEAIGESRPGRVEIRANLERLSEEQVRAQFPVDRIAPGAYVRIAVIDDGAGMDEDIRSRMFDPFFTTRFTGRGLGLAAVMGIVEGHHGAIRVASTPGLGTTFEVLLPAAEAPVPAEEPAAAVRRAPPGATVLVIDDEEIVRNIAGAVLERMGFNVLTAANGREGVEIFQERHTAISLVVLDLLMPEMGGEETLGRLQAIEPGVPVLLSSGLDESEAARRFQGKRLAGFIQKPYDLKRLMNSVSIAMPRETGD